MHCCTFLHVAFNIRGGSGVRVGALCAFRLICPFRMLHACFGCIAKPCRLASLAGGTAHQGRIQGDLGGVQSSGLRKGGLPERLVHGHGPSCRSICTRGYPSVDCRPLVLLCAFGLECTCLRTVLSFRCLRVGPCSPQDVCLSLACRQLSHVLFECTCL